MVCFILLKRGLDTGYQTKEEIGALMEDIPRAITFVDLVDIAQERREWRFMVACVDQDMAHR